jgi:hypothetical protein
MAEQNHKRGTRRKFSEEFKRDAFDSVRRFVDEGLAPAVKVAGKSAIVLGVVVLVASSPLDPYSLSQHWTRCSGWCSHVKRVGRTAQTMV